MEISRRQLLKVIVVAAGTVEACSSDIVQPQGVSPEENLAFFPQSVASGDPRSDSVILWTRLFDPDDATSDHTLTVEVGLDPVFTVKTARATGLASLNAHDGNVKVKVTGLRPSTYYYYRFIYEKGGKPITSPVGRTKTAPAANDTNAVRFAVASCQDFIGRYFNTWHRAAMISDELDFIAFIGDYVYETTGDPSFQAPGDKRAIVFTDIDGAIPLGTDVVYYAAQSLSNYRELYRAARSDAFLRAMHESYPFVFMWDDHEYADDCHGATATYTNGTKDETNVERRRNAELAFFEYMPLEHPNATADAVDFDALPRYPDTRIYRDLTFGKNLRIAMTDFRTYRPDHLVPEDAFPGTVIVDAAGLAAAGLDSAFSSDAYAYVNIDDPQFATAKTYLGFAYQKLASDAGLDSAATSERASAVLKGNLALAFVNAVLTNPSIDQPPIDPAGKPRGLAWVHMGKRDLFTRQGTRYVVVKDALDAYSAIQYAATQGASENVYGDAQEAWLDETLAGPETWKMLVSSVSFTSLMVDLRDKTDVTDATLRERFYLNADIWDGFPSRRRALLDKLSKVGSGNVFVVSGDIHASFASVENAVPCLTAPAISSLTVKGGAAGVVVGAGFDPSSAIYKYGVTQIDESFREANPGIVFSDCDSHGFLVIEVKSDEVNATFHLIAGANAETDYASRSKDLAAKFVQKKFLVTPGSIVPA
jgi:alkaline phosphatase D